MERIVVFNDATITQNTAINKTINLEGSDIPGLWNDTGALAVFPVSVQAEFAGAGSITITIAWTISGKTFVAQAFLDGTGDVSVIAGATGTCWDIVNLPVKPSAVKITVTETNVGAITQLDLFLSI